VSIEFEGVGAGKSAGPSETCAGDMLARVAKRPRRGEGNEVIGCEPIQINPRWKRAGAFQVRVTQKSQCDSLSRTYLKHYCGVVRFGVVSNRRSSLAKRLHPTELRPGTVSVFLRGAFSGRNTSIAPRAFHSFGGPFISIAVQRMRSGRCPTHEK
jgi:hypothetical protein